ncbi:hypothetical protein B4135_0368 [Caldibacillus debilis]|uniref:Uncharacterized protein n=1 Tax=Caldibacillus debilis TaxID=301148 RepID=A0A150LL94_9BACI|nr:hypothetical protein B4135_0368 [Caldibacillus debilis]
MSGQGSHHASQRFFKGEYQEIAICGVDLLTPQMKQKNLRHITGGNSPYYLFDFPTSRQKKKGFP